MWKWLTLLFASEKKALVQQQPQPRADPVGRSDGQQMPGRQPVQPPPAQPARRAGVLPQQNAGSAPARPIEQADPEGQSHLVKLRAKLTQLADQFATGRINQKQFEELYEHYQAEYAMVEQMLLQNPDSDDWKNAVSDGKSVIIRRRYSARLLGFAIYNRLSGMPLKTIGEFGLDADLFVPMLHAYQSATQEIFGGGMQSTQIEGGHWLCFAPGNYSTTIALFSTEPSKRQISKLGELQELFEKANRHRLSTDDIDPGILVCPHEFFISHPF
jgi:hypothetical protein